MQKPSKKQRAQLERWTQRYADSLAPEGEAYLAIRGVFNEKLIKELRLGFVASPMDGHEHVRGHEHLEGRLVIPYIDKMGVYGLKFRCAHVHIPGDLHEQGYHCPKYLTLQGTTTSLYNVLDTDTASGTIHIAEGELDCITLKQVFDQPTVAVPGVKNWQVHHPYHFQGFERVIVWADGDEAGSQLARRIQSDVSGVEIAAMPRGMDVNSLYLERGESALRELIGEEDE